MPNPSPIVRYPYSITGLTANVLGGTAGRIAYGGAAGGMVFVTGVTLATTLTWYVSDTLGGTLYPACDANGNALSVTIANGKAYEIPGALYGAPEITPVTNSGSATLNVSLKS